MTQMARAYSIRLDELLHIALLLQEHEDSTDCHACENSDDYCASCQGAIDLRCKLEDAMSLAEAGVEVTLHLTPLKPSVSVTIDDPAWTKFEPPDERRFDG
jgi:hypothetical protein